MNIREYIKETALALWQGKAKPVLSVQVGSNPDNRFSGWLVSMRKDARDLGHWGAILWRSQDGVSYTLLDRHNYLTARECTGPNTTWVLAVRDVVNVKSKAHREAA
jgi:hypothetical protein